MAKRTQSTSQTGDTRMLGFAEDLGRILGTTQAKATAWLGQRQQIAKQLTQVRDAAERLLGELTGGATRSARGRRVRQSAATEQPRRRRRRMSAAARKKMSDAAKRRWAERKAKSGKNA